MKLSFTFILLIVLAFFTRAQSQILKAYPNPFSDSLTIELDFINNTDTLRLRMYNRWGETIKSFFEDTVISEQVTVKLYGDTLEEGVYLISLKRNNHSNVGQLVTKMNTTTGLLITNLKSESTFYPNPVQHELNVTSPASIKKYRLVDLTGKVVLQGSPASSQFTIDLSALPKGNYLLHLKTETGALIERVIKE